ncbi:gamma-glutamylcyclotransferase [Alteromonas sp. A079]|uniref:gamma-glutamylcyclotransferase n=1 Tax=Alteromonas sp. A079 TaxID=3410268 RepID=UPI003B9F8C1D
MLSDNDIATWLRNIDTQHIVLGYGSLLSKDSRERFSQIHTLGIPVRVDGFQRAWVTRSLAESQTYVGALVDATSQLTAQLIPTSINPRLREREKDYQFVQVPHHAISFSSDDAGAMARGALEKHTYWLCETLACEPATAQYPVHQTYIDTCLSGCLEHGGAKEAKAFIDLTSHWQHPRVNDRNAVKYPRAAHVSDAVRSEIDALLTAHQE